MKGLSSLIRLHKWQLKEEQRKMADLAALRDQAADRIGQLDSEIEVENRIAGLSPEATHALGRFVQASLQRRRNLEETIAVLNGQLEEAEERVAEAFQVLKRFEITLEQQQAAQRKLAKRREQLSQDEMALNMYRLKKTGIW